MICSACKTNNNASAKYCSNCGKELNKELYKKWSVNPRTGQRTWEYTDTPPPATPDWVAYTLYAVVGIGILLLVGWQWASSHI